MVRPVARNGFALEVDGPCRDRTYDLGIKSSPPLTDQPRPTEMRNGILHPVCRGISPCLV
jgi:hypothetical protein